MAPAGPGQRRRLQRHGRYAAAGGRPGARAGGAGISGRVIVLGAINQDLVVNVPRLPRAGETVLGDELVRHFGGKGANQAVAAARVGASVVMLGAVGADEAGEAGLAELAADGVDVRHVLHVQGSSGTAMIAVAPDGANQIVVAAGANARISGTDVRRVLPAVAPAAGDVLLASLEVPIEAVAAAVARAAAEGARVVVNPAPAQQLPEEVLRAHPVLTPNRAELAELSRSPDLATEGQLLLDRGARAVVATLGEEGCTIFSPDEDPVRLPARQPKRVVDSTGAGDTFSGVLAAWLANGRSVREAAEAANLAASMSVESAGARGGMPARDALLALLAEG